MNDYVWLYRALAVIGSAGFLVMATFALALASQATEESSCSQWVNCANPGAIPPIAKGLLALVFIFLMGPLAGHLGKLWALSFPKPSSLQTVEREP